MLDGVAMAFAARTICRLNRLVLQCWPHTSVTRMFSSRGVRLIVYVVHHPRAIVEKVFGEAAERDVGFKHGLGDIVL